MERRAPLLAGERRCVLGGRQPHRAADQRARRRAPLDLHPANGTITLTTPFTPPEPDVAKWRNISFKPVASDDGDMAELTVVVEDNVHGAYGLLTSIADELQLEGEPLAAAVASAIAKHRDMFAGKAALSQDKEVGLFGELLVLEYLIDKIGAGPAVAVLAGTAVRGARLRLRRRASGGQDDRPASSVGT